MEFKTKKDKFIVVSIILHIVLSFFIFNWLYPHINRFFDEFAKYDYEIEKRDSMLGYVYSRGFTYGKYAVDYYEEDIFGDPNKRIEDIAEEQFQERKPSSIEEFVKSDRYTFDFPDEKKFNQWALRSEYGTIEIAQAAFKSGYLDGFIQTYKYE